MPSLKDVPGRARAGARGQVGVWPGGVLWIGTAFRAGAVHAHHALQLSFGDADPLSFHTEKDSTWQAYDACLIPSNLPHALDSTGRRYLNILIDPVTAEGRRIRPLAAADAIVSLEHAGARAAADRLFTLWSESHDCARLIPAAQAVVQALAGTTPLAAATDARVLGALDLIRVRLDRRVTLTEVARELHLSPSRLRHLFVQEVGLPFSTYVLWERLQLVIAALGTGNLTQAALAAGFADAAHMSRTFRRMFGLSPSELDRA